LKRELVGFPNRFRKTKVSRTQNFFSSMRTPPPPLCSWMMMMMILLEGVSWIPKQVQKDKRERTQKKIQRFRNSSIKSFCVHGWMMMMFEEVVSWIPKRFRKDKRNQKIYPKNKE